MNINIRSIFYLAIVFLSIWFLYTQRHVLSPFVVAMIFAYVFNPLINFFSKYLKFPRSLSIIVVYVILITSAIFLVSFIARSVFAESESITRNVDTFLSALKNDVNSFPDWTKPIFSDYIDYFSKVKFFENIFSSPVPFVSKAFFGLVNFFVFLFSAFFFLKDGDRMKERLMLLFPRESRRDITALLGRINDVLSAYLRGQIILVLSMIVMLFLAFTVIGARNALTISLISALFEIVPFIGPIVAAVFGTFLITISGITNFSLGTLQTALVVILIYYASRQIQDYLISPFLIGRATRLHPLFVLFSVLAGEHIYGVVGVLLAVPVAATIKIILEFAANKFSPKIARSKL